MKPEIECCQQVDHLLQSVLEREPEPARFEQEAGSAAALYHPNIVTIHEIVHTDSGCIIVELVNDKTLREIPTSGPMPAKKLLDPAVQITRGPAHAHAAGIIHRD